MLMLKVIKNKYLLQAYHRNNLENGGEITCKPHLCIALFVGTNCEILTPITVLLYI